MNVWVKDKSLLVKLLEIIVLVNDESLLVKLLEMNVWVNDKSLLVNLLELKVVLIFSQFVEVSDNILVKLLDLIASNIEESWNQNTDLLDDRTNLKGLLT